MPAIEVSCPSCGKENIVETKRLEPLNREGIGRLLESLIGDMCVRMYTFNGENRCAKCGKEIIVSIEVRNSSEKMVPDFSFLGTING